MRSLPKINTTVQLRRLKNIGARYTTLICKTPHWQSYGNSSLILSQCHTSNQLHTVAGNRRRPQQDVVTGAYQGTYSDTQSDSSLQKPISKRSWHVGDQPIELFILRHHLKPWVLIISVFFFMHLGPNSHRENTIGNGWHNGPYAPSRSILVPVSGLNAC